MGDAMSTERQEAKAEVAAEKARAKAMRPWWKKKRFLILLALVAIVAISAAAGGGDDAKSVATKADDAVEGAADDVRSNSDNDTHPPQDDVKVATCAVETVLGLPKATGTIHNNSSKQSNYSFHVEFLQGTTRVAEGYGLENDVAAGQDVNWDATGDKTDVKGPITCRLTSVERYAT